MLGVISVAIGLFTGFLTSFMFKHWRFLSASAIIETVIIFGMSLLSYFLAEFTVISGTAMSGIIALLTSAIMQAQYTWYNLSPQGKSSSAVTFAYLGTMMEGAVYAYVGIGLYSVIPQWWSF